MSDTLKPFDNTAPVVNAAIPLAAPRIGPASAPLIGASERILLLMEDKLPGGIGHARLVAEAMAALGTEVGFDRDHVEVLTCAGLLHDIGCAYWPAQLLTKPGRWNSDDIIRSQQHPIEGAAMVEEIETLRATGPWILQHHERLDGRGYPFNLTESKLSFEGRLLAVVEVFAASITWRAGRPALSPAQTVERLKQAATVGLPVAPDEDPNYYNHPSDDDEKEGYGEPSLDPVGVEALLAVLQKALPDPTIPLDSLSAWPSGGITLDSPALRHALGQTFRAVAEDLLASYESHAGPTAATELRGQLHRHFSQQRLPVTMERDGIKIHIPEDWTAARIASTTRMAMALQTENMDNLLQRPDAARIRDNTYSRLTSLGQELAERYDLFDGLSLSNERFAGTPSIVDTKKVSKGEPDS